MPIKKYSPIIGAIWRFARVAVAVVIAGIAAEYGDSSVYLALAPFLVALDKFVRASK